MEVREAVAAAKRYLQEIFSEEPMSNLALEEVEFDESAGVWCITFGFSRTWDKPEDFHPLLTGRPVRRWPRDYKVVRVSDETGQVLSIKSRETSHAA